MKKSLVSLSLLNCLLASSAFAQLTYTFDREKFQCTDQNGKPGQNAGSVECGSQELTPNNYGTNFDLTNGYLPGYVLGIKSSPNYYFGTISLNQADITAAQITISDTTSLALNNATAQKLRLILKPGSSNTSANISATGLDASQMTLKDSNFSSMTLNTAELSSATFETVNVKTVNFTSVSAPQLKLTKSNITNAFVVTDSNLSKATFDQVSLNNAKFIRSDLSYAVLDRVACYSCSIEDAGVTGLSLKQAQANKLILKKVKGNLVNATAAQLAEAQLSDVQLPGVILDSANLSSAILTTVALPKASLKATTLSGAKLSAVDLSQSNLQQLKAQGTTISKTNLSGANVTDALLLGTKMSESDLTAANFSRARAANMEFNGSVLVSTQFAQADLKWAKFVNTNMQNAQLGQADVSWASFQGANVKGADLSTMIFNEYTIFTGAIYNDSTKLPFGHGEAKNRGMLYQQN